MHALYMHAININSYTVYNYLNGQPKSCVAVKLTVVFIKHVTGGGCSGVRHPKHRGTCTDKTGTVEPLYKGHSQLRILMKHFRWVTSVLHLFELSLCPISVQAWSAMMSGHPKNIKGFSATHTLILQSRYVPWCYSWYPDATVLMS